MCMQELHSSASNQGHAASCLTVTAARTFPVCCMLLQDPKDPYLKDYDDEIIMMLTDQSDQSGEDNLMRLYQVRMMC